VHHPRPEQLGVLLDPRPHLRIRRRELHLVENRVHIQGRTPDDDRDHPAPMAIGDHLPGEVPDDGDRRWLPRVEHVDEVVDDSPTLVQRGLGRADVHPAVELHRIGVHDLGRSPIGLESTRQGDGEVGLAGGRRTDDREHPARAHGDLPAADAVGKWRRDD